MLSLSMQYYFLLPQSLYISISSIQTLCINISIPRLQWTRIVLLRQSPSTTPCSLSPPGPVDKSKGTCVFLHPCYFGI